MKRFEGCSANGEFFVGCTGQTVYLYDRNNQEIKRFKDLIYAYTPMISPDGKIFVVKSKDGRLAVYSLETLSLIKKFRYSEVDGAQDDGFCFSADGKLFFNLERQTDACHSAVSVYDTRDFTLLGRGGLSDVMLEHIEYDRDTQTCYLLGYARDSNGIFDHPIVAMLNNDQLVQVTPISKKDYRFYSSYMESKMMGLTETMGENQLILMGHPPQSYEWKWMTDQLELIRSGNYSLGNLHRQYHS